MKKNILYILLFSLFIQPSNSSTNDEKNSLHLFIARSPDELDWSTGKRRITFGHNNLELKCDGEVLFYAGMHYMSKSEGAELIFKHKSDLGLLFHNMAGRFHTKEDIEIAKEDYLNGKTSIVSFNLSREKCLNLKKYFQNYIKNGEQFNYGLNNNPFISISKPLVGEEIKKFKQNEKGIPFGAGCTAFVMSSLQEIGVFDYDAFEKWYSKVRVPEKYVGHFSDQLYTSADDRIFFKSFNQNPGKKVSIQNIIAKAHRWAKPDEEGRDIVY